MQRPIALGCEQPVGLHHRNHVVVFDGYLEIAEADVLEHVGFLERGGDERLGRGTAVLGVQLLVERSGVDSDAQADARVGGALQMSGPTWSNLRMLPGFTRTAAQPASMAWNTYFDWKWMSAMIGIGDLATICGKASASSWLGTATRTMSQPAAVSSAICCSVAGTFAVSVLVIDCTEMGAPPPTGTGPTMMRRDLRRGCNGSR